jgi:CRISPR/Cas system type I-B associated protein Csh2 (Cas7 group RAMP superfamily)
VKNYEFGKLAELVRLCANWLHVKVLGPIRTTAEQGIPIKITAEVKITVETTAEQGIPIKTIAGEKITVEITAKQKASVFEGNKVAETENRTRCAV